MISFPGRSDMMQGTTAAESNQFEELFGEDEHAELERIPQVKIDRVNRV